MSDFPAILVMIQPHNFMVLKRGIGEIIRKSRSHKAYRGQ